MICNVSTKRLQWTSIFSEATYELNGIACQDATHCVAVGSDDNGAYIVTTSDGNTFNMTANITTAGAGECPPLPSPPAIARHAAARCPRVRCDFALVADHHGVLQSL